MKPTPALLLAVLCACRSIPAAAPASPPPPPPPSTSAPSPIAEDIVVQTNAQRKSLGLPVLARNALLMRAAQIQADQMAASDTFEHQLPGAAYPNLESRISAVHYVHSTAAENIAEGYSSAAAVVAGWMTSPGHRANIVSTAFTEMGAGAATSKNGHRYHVQVFARPR